MGKTYNRTLILTCLGFRVAGTELIRLKDGRMILIRGPKRGTPQFVAKEFYNLDLKDPRVKPELLVLYVNPLVFKPVDKLLVQAKKLNIDVCLLATGESVIGIEQKWIPEWAKRDFLNGSPVVKIIAPRPRSVISVFVAWSMR